MAKHVWLRKPTPAMLRRLLTAYDYVLDREPDLPKRSARAFAGYYAETQAQTTNRFIPAGGPKSILVHLHKSVTNSGWRFLRGDNAKNYIDVFEKNVMEVGLEAFRNDLNLDPDMPWQVICDYLTDAGLVQDAERFHYLLGD